MLIFIYRFFHSVIQNKTLGLHCYSYPLDYQIWLKIYDHKIPIFSQTMFELSGSISRPKAF